MSANRKRGESAWVDPDDAPEITGEMLEQADVYHGDKLISRGRGRPKEESTKERITIRLDPEVVDSFRTTGPGWQSRMNQALKVYLREHNPGDLR